MHASDSVSVVLAEHQPRKLTPLPLPGNALTKVMADLRKTKPGLSDARIPDAIQAARELLSHGRNTRKVVIVLSDHQRYEWEAKDLARWNTALGQRVKGDKPERRAVRDGRPAGRVVAERDGPRPDDHPRPGQHGPAFGDQGRGGQHRPQGRPRPARPPDRRPQGADAKDEVKDAPRAHRRPAGHPPLTPGSSQNIKFEYTFTDPHSNWLRVEVDAADGLDEDNRAVASAYVWQALPVLVVDGGLASTGPDSTASESTLRTFKNSRFLLQAMLSDAANPDAPPLVRPTVISAFDSKLPGLPLDEYAAVIVNDVPSLPAAFQNKLADYANAGHGVWVILGRNSDKSFVRDGLAQAGLVRLDLKEQQAAVETAPRSTSPTRTTRWSGSSRRPSTTCSPACRRSGGGRSGRATATRGWC